MNRNAWAKRLIADALLTVAVAPAKSETMAAPATSAAQTKDTGAVVLLYHRFGEDA